MTAAGRGSAESPADSSPPLPGHQTSSTLDRGHPLSLDPILDFENSFSAQGYPQTLSQRI